MPLAETRSAASTNASFAASHSHVESETAHWDATFTNVERRSVIWEKIVFILVNTHLQLVSAYHLIFNFNEIKESNNKHLYIHPSIRIHIKNKRREKERGRKKK